MADILKLTDDDIIYNGDYSPDDIIKLKNKYKALEQKNQTLKEWMSKVMGPLGNVFSNLGYVEEGRDLLKKTLPSKRGAG